MRELECVCVVCVCVCVVCVCVCVVCVCVCVHVGGLVCYLFLLLKTHPCDSCCCFFE